MGLVSPTACAYSRIFSRPTSYSAAGHCFPIRSMFTATAAGFYSRVELQNREERLLRHLHPPHLLHALLARLLLLEQLPLPGHVAPVQLRGHVLAQRLDRLPREHPRADRCLHRHVEELARDRPLEALHERPAGRVRL